MVKMSLHFTKLNVIALELEVMALGNDHKSDEFLDNNCEYEGYV